MSSFINAFNSGYAKPALLTSGSGPGTITPQPYGWDLSGFADTCFAYLDKPKTSGKWHWEYQYITSSWHLTGIAYTITPQAYGGYSSVNAGHYTAGGHWKGGGLTGGSAGSATITPVTNNIITFELDLDSATKTLNIYIDNVLSGTISWTNTVTIWPMFAFQSGPSCKVKVGPAGCTYPPSSGYQYL